MVFDDGFGFFFFGGDDGVVNDGVEVIDLGIELDFDGFVGLDFSCSFFFVCF